MKLIIQFLCISFPYLLVGQNKKGYVLTTNYTRFISYQMQTDEFHIGGGIKLNEHFTTFLALKRLQDHHDISATYKSKIPLRIYSISLIPSYRVLSENKKVSPLVALDFGIPFYSNGKGKFLNGNFSLLNGITAARRRYDKGLFLGKAKFLVDFKIKQFNIGVGACYNLYLFKVTSVHPYSNPGSSTYEVGPTIQWYERGIGFEANLSYTIKGKKD